MKSIFILLNPSADHHCLFLLTGEEATLSVMLAMGHHLLVSVQKLPAHQLPQEIMNPKRRAQDLYIISPNFNVTLSVITQGFLLQFQKTGGSNLTASQKQIIVCAFPPLPAVPALASSASHIKVHT